MCQSSFGFIFIFLLLLFFFYYLDCFAYAYFPRNPQCGEKRERERDTQRTFFFFVWRSSIWLTWRVVCPRKKETNSANIPGLDSCYGSHREEMNFVPGIWGEDKKFSFFPPFVFCLFLATFFSLILYTPLKLYFITPKPRDSPKGGKKGGKKNSGCWASRVRVPKTQSTVLVCVFYLRRHIDLDLISLTWSARERDAHERQHRLCYMVGPNGRQIGAGG